MLISKSPRNQKIRYHQIALNKCNSLFITQTLNKMAFQEHISNREQEVLKLVAFEHTAQEIATQLYISINTVKTHKKNLLDKLDVRNMAGLVRKGFELGILQLSQ